ncbi:MAG: hypothetical protein R3A48_19160 [Polyangiales bacterium]
MSEMLPVTLLAVLAHPNASTPTLHPMLAAILRALTRCLLLRFP